MDEADVGRDRDQAERATDRSASAARGAGRRRSSTRSRSTKAETPVLAVDTAESQGADASDVAESDAEGERRPRQESRRKAAGRRKSTRRPAAASEDQPAASGSGGAPGAALPSPQPVVSEGVPAASTEGTPQAGSAVSGTVGEPQLSQKGRRGRSKADQGELGAPQKPARNGTRARIAVRKGLPEIVVGDETLLPAILFGNVAASGAARRVHNEARRAVECGVRILSTLVELVCPPPADGSVYRAMDERIEPLLGVAPHVYALPRIVFVPGEKWREQYPMEMQSYARGGGEDPSIASDHFWEEAGRSLRLLIEHVKRTSYGHRVIGYHLERGEWFQPVDAGFDQSYANREAFRRWLRRKYSDNDVLLRASWYDGEAHFYTADIPPPPQPNAHTAFFDPRRERRWVDYIEYVSDITVQRIIDLARVVKEATDGNALVSVCYGYTWEFSHPWSGHLALHRLLECPHVDIVTGPISYAERSPGSSGAMPAPADSVALHAKLWMVEDDTKTHLAKPSSVADPFNPRMENGAATEAVHLRTIGTALAHQVGVAWMDLWGEGWLDSDAMWKTLGGIIRTSAHQAKTRRRTAPEVVALIDEGSLCHCNGGETLMQRLLQGDRDSLLRCGASVGFYLQSDVTDPGFPTDAKLYLFLNPYRLPDDQRDAIRSKLVGGGRTLAWFYSVGTMTYRGAAEEATPEVVGLTLRPQPWNSEIGTRITEVGHPITQSLGERTLGVRTRLNPSYYADVDAPETVVLGEYEQTGLPSLVVRSCAGGHTVFCGEPVLTPELLRGLCRFAGVHLYTRAPEDYAHAGYGWLSMHVLREGQRTLTLPEGQIVCDVSEQCCSAPGAREYRTPVRTHTTRLFYVGQPDQAKKLGFDVTRVRTAPPPPTLPPPPPLPRFDEVPTPSADIATEPAAVQAVVATDQSVEAAPEAGNLTAATVESHAEGGERQAAKRRRRRGGRGRSRRKKGSGDAENQAGDAGAASNGTA